MSEGDCGSIIAIEKCIEELKTMDRDTVNRIFKSPPELYTKRLLLRKMQKTDSADMHEYASREEVSRYLLWNPHESLGYTYRYLTYLQSRYRAGEFYDWAVVLKEQQKMIGTAGFTKFYYDDNAAEIGYVLNDRYWGNGFAVEAAAEVIKFGFEVLKLNRIEARYIVGNDQSLRVMQKLRMKHEGIMRESLLNKGRYVSVGVCSILKSEYEAIVDEMLVQERKIYIEE